MVKRESLPEEVWRWLNTYEGEPEMREVFGTGNPHEVLATYSIEEIEKRMAEYDDEHTIPFS